MRQANEEVAHQPDDHRGEPFGRLVHDKKTRIAEERPGDREHLLLAARQLAAAVVAPLGEAGKGRIDALDCPAALRARAQAQRLVDREARPEAAALRDVADAGASDLMRLEANEFEAVEADGPGPDGHEPDDRIAERRLAHAVAADDRKDASLERQ